MTAGRPVVIGVKHMSVSPSTRPSGWSNLQANAPRTPHPVQLSNQRSGLSNIWGRMMARILKKTKTKKKRPPTAKGGRDGA
ncbi:hypothetical protein CSPX01_09719 [Colletotrichum filicis]|nr:hypothetical protein CSPX01_09719 [Colletotrichum filicis]